MFLATEQTRSFVFLFDWLQNYNKAQFQTNVQNTIFCLVSCLSHIIKSVSQISRVVNTFLDTAASLKETSVHRPKLFFCKKA